MKRFYSVVFAVLLFLLSVFPALAQEPIIGEIRLWAGSQLEDPDAGIPAGWQLADGHNVEITFPICNHIQNTFGTAPAGYCKLPNLAGRVAVGLNPTQTQFDALGETGGEISHQLSEAEMPSHTHTQNPHNHSLPYSGTGGNGYQSYKLAAGIESNVTINPSTATNQNTGGGQPHNNLQPYLVLYYIIYTGYDVTPTPTPTATPTETATPTATPTGSVTPTATTTSTLYLPYVITTTLQSGTILSVPEQVSFGQIITSGIVLSLLAVVALDFLFRLVYRR